MGRVKRILLLAAALGVAAGAHGRDDQAADEAEGVVAEPTAQQEYELEEAEAARKGIAGFFQRSADNITSQLKGGCTGPPTWGIAAFSRWARTSREEQVPEQWPRCGFRPLGATQRPAIAVAAALATPAAERGPTVCIVTGGSIDAGKLASILI